MKKLRRIEITTFRRRTTIVLRDRSTGGPTGWPVGDGEASHPVPAEQTLTREFGLDRTQSTNLTVDDESDAWDE